MQRFSAIGHDWFLLPPDLKEWLAANDVAHFIVTVVERVFLAYLQVPERSGGKPQYHRAYNAQAVVCADGSQLVLATNLDRFQADWNSQRGLAHCFREQLYQPDYSSQADVALVATTADAFSFTATILAMEKPIGLKAVLADTGYASGPAVAVQQTKDIEPLVAIGRTQPCEQPTHLNVVSETTLNAAHGGPAQRAS